MNKAMRQSGFAYIAAVILLVVVAGVCVALLRLSGTQQDTVNQAVLGARASLAARAGIEWGFYQLRTGACNAAPRQLTDVEAESGFRVTVSCSFLDFSEGEDSAGSPVAKRSVRVEAVACNSGGSCPSFDPAVLTRPDYVERRRVATTCTMGGANLC
ncbi:MSHA biogenesis protein MshP [Massilia yuzhufengensis]|uniref:MSHA biogenesis protein MshP n=1 Tax=Massilia yuzhufengensis TaxID=1164594 RepID=A0A1I1LT33_9BURK|nr:MSHA biogenesis protein MshP [Massilia yuzhufengensis]SFC72620.1 MSHA biogenesis protein MshP [Massilia yuzhufengensis]